MAKTGHRWRNLLVALAARRPAFSFLLSSFCPCLLILFNSTRRIQLFQGQCVYMRTPIVVGSVQLLFLTLFSPLDWILPSSPGDYMTVLMYWCGRMRLSGIFSCHLIDWLSHFHEVWSDAVDNFDTIQIATLLCPVCVSGFLIPCFPRTLQRSPMSKLQDWKELPVTLCPIFWSVVSQINSKTSCSILQQPGSYCIHLSTFEFFPRGNNLPYRVS